MRAQASSRARAARHALAWMVGAVLAASTAPAAGEGFVGETKCGNPRCHGASLPVAGREPADWRPWKSARNQWRTESIDRHSRAYRTLETAESKAIAGYMGISATRSDKCLRCHAPRVQNASDSRHELKDGVSCEHCHGPAQAWLEPHVEKDWPSKRKSFLSRGFVDLDDFETRSETCVECHLSIDHEIVAGGHPPLQFELVAYAQVMKHWDDQDEVPPGSFSVDPKLWAVGQLVGLEDAARMVARRAGEAAAGQRNYQAIQEFSHFESKNCYQCHHKLIDDAMRQGAGHFQMADAVFTVSFPGDRATLGAKWKALEGAVPNGAEPTRAAALELQRWVAGYASKLSAGSVDQAATRKLLSTITSRGGAYAPIKRFDYRRRPAPSNVLALRGIESPWWYTTGAPEQVVLAIQALCDPAVGAERCYGANGIVPDLQRLVGAVDRFAYDPAAFESSLASIRRKLF